MKFALLTLAALLMAGFCSALAVDVMPTKDQGAAKKKNDQAGAGPGWFSGVMDGSPEVRNKKVDKVLKIKREEFDLSLTMEPTSVSRGSASSDKAFSIQPFFTVTSKAKLMKSFSFESSQKYDFVILDSGGKEVLRWSEGITFNDTAGISLLNPGESIRFTEVIPLVKDDQRLPAGQYTLQAEIKGYPEFTEKIPFTITP